MNTRNTDHDKYNILICKELLETYLFSFNMKGTETQRKLKILFAQA